MIQQGTQIDPVPPGFQDLVYKLHISTIHPITNHPLENHRRCVHEKARQNTVPLILLVTVALNKLACAHGKVTTLRHLVTRNNIRNENWAVIITRGEDVVRTVRPWIERDLVGRKEGRKYGFFLEDVIEHVIRYEQHLVGELVSLTAVATLYNLHEKTT